jgi:integrase
MSSSAACVPPHDRDPAAHLNTPAASEPEWSPAIALAINTGLRLGELLPLRSADFDAKAESLTRR